MKSTVAVVAAGCAIVAALLVALLRSDDPPSTTSPASPDASPSQLAQSPGSADGTTSPTALASAPDAAAKRLEVTAESTPPPATAERRTLTGRVVDERRMPVSNATLELRKNNATVETATSDAAGRFTLSPPVATLEGGVAVIARAGPDRCASKPWGESKFFGADVGTIVLAHASALRVLVTRDGAPVADALVAVDVGKSRESMFAARTDASGRVTIDGVPDGFTMVRAEHADGMGRKRAFLPEEADVEVALAPTNTFEVLVVEKDTHVPIAGAKLSVTESYGIPSLHQADESFIVGDSSSWRELPDRGAVTDADGRARFANFDASASFNVSLTADGFRRIPGGPPEGPRRLLTAPSPQIIEMTRSTRRDVRVPVVAGEMPVPAEGTALTLRFDARNWGEKREPPSALVMGRGEFVIPAWEGNGSFAATASDGAIAFVGFQEDANVADETSFVRPRSIAVRAIDAMGKPIAGARAGAFDQGNNPVCDDVVTDADGHAAIRDLLPERFNVRVASPGQAGERTDAGSVDLTKGDGTVEAVLPRAVTALLRIRIDGVPALPSLFRIGAGMRTVIVLEEFPERGELRIAIDVPASELGKPMKVGFKGSGELTGNAEFVPVLGGPEPVVLMDLTRTSRLDVVVTRPPKTRVSIGIEMRNPATGVFAGVHSTVSGSISIANGPGDTFRFGNLKPGVYRATDSESKTATPEVTVGAGTIATVAFAISGRTMVTGKVAFPDGTDTMSIRVIAEAPGLVPGNHYRPSETFPDGVMVAKDGSFEIQIPGDREVVIRPWHPWLQPAAPGGRITTTDGATGVTLQLVAGQEVRLPAPDLTASRFTHNVPRVGFWRGPIAGPPERWLAAPLVDGELRFGGLEPGTYSFLVDVMFDFAPLQIADVVVVAGTTRLPAASFKRGAALRVRLLTTAGFDPPRVFVYATRTGQPSYARGFTSSGEAEVVVPGLGAGEFQVSASSMSNRSKAIDRKITCDGTNDVTFDFDLR
jgi:hypothetical protein